MLRPALEEGASQSQIARTHQLSKSAVQPRSRFTPVPVALRSALPLALWSFHLENCDSHGLYKQTLPPLPLGPYPLFFHFVCRINSSLIVIMKSFSWDQCASVLKTLNNSAKSL